MKISQQNNKKKIIDFSKIIHVYTRGGFRGGRAGSFLE
jgi:hypothetical protein